MLASRITSKGQVTIPLELRRLLCVSPGDKLVFSEAGDGALIVRKVDEKSSLAGSLASKITKTATDAELDAAIKEGWRADARD